MDTEDPSEDLYPMPPHTTLFCDCGELLATCDCSSCTENGTNQKIVYPSTCARCMQRPLIKGGVPALELGVNELASAAGTMLFVMRGAAMAVPLVHLRALLHQAEALHIEDDAVVGVVLHTVSPLAPANLAPVGTNADADAPLTTGACCECGKTRLLHGPYCIPCGLAHRAEATE